VQWLLSVIEGLTAFMGNMFMVEIATPDNLHQLNINTASTQRRLSVNRVSTILGVATCVIQGLLNGIYLYSKYSPSLENISLESISLHIKLSIATASKERQQLWLLHVK
jgi:hypothetical protein